MAATSFESTEDLAEYQSNCEILEALRVQSLSPDERFRWLQNEWGRLQDDATLLFSATTEQAGTSRCFTSFAEKNRFDEDREIMEALRYSNGIATQ